MKQFNRILESEKKSEYWRKSALVPISKNKSVGQSCSNYGRIKLMSYTMKMWERVVEVRLRDRDDLGAAVWFHAKKEDYRHNVCFENADEEV